MSTNSPLSISNLTASVDEKIICTASTRCRARRDPCSHGPQRQVASPPWAMSSWRPGRQHRERGLHNLLTAPISPSYARQRSRAGLLPLLQAPVGGSPACRCPASCAAAVAGRPGRRDARQGVPSLREEPPPSSIRTPPTNRASGRRLLRRREEKGRDAAAPAAPAQARHPRRDRLGTTPTRPAVSRGMDAYRKATDGLC